MKLFFMFIGELQGFPPPALMALQAPLRQRLRHEDETRPPDVAATHLSGGGVRGHGPDGHAEVTALCSVINTLGGGLIVVF